MPAKPVLRLLSTVLTARNCASFAAALPPPVTMRTWTPACAVAMRASPDLVARALSTQIGAVDRNAPGELAPVLAQAHDLHELVLDQPRGAVANAQVALEFKSGDAVLRLRQQVHGQGLARQAVGCQASCRLE